MNPVWQLLESDPADIVFHMQEDRRFFEEFIQNPEVPPLLRIYRVRAPAITVGRTFSPSRSDVPVCVRPTGGGLVRHGNDLIYSVIARRDSFPTFHQVRMSYLSFHESVQAAFRKLEREAELFRCDDLRAKKNSKASSRLMDCFERPVPTDVKWKGQKIAGGAQWRRREGFLHQGSIQLLEGISFDSLKEALLEAFREKFEIEFEKTLLIR